MQPHSDLSVREPSGFVPMTSRRARRPMEATHYGEARPRPAGMVATVMLGMKKLDIEPLVAAANES